MELNYLRVFYEVAKSGKFSESAKKLSISQSALSRSVSLLEESEGVVLFDRSKNGVKLTPKGLDVFRLCEKLFQTEKEIEKHIYVFNTYLLVKDSIPVWTHIRLIIGEFNVSCLLFVIDALRTSRFSHNLTLHNLDCLLFGSYFKIYVGFIIERIIVSPDIITTYVINV